MKTYKISILAIFTLMLVSCSQYQDDFKADITLKSIDLLKFNDIDEYEEILLRILSMNTTELKEYEESKGYLSYGRECEEFYNSIDFEKFKTFEELNSFVEENDDYLVLNKEDDGEIYLETVFNKNINRYFINKDRLFQIGDKVYKVFNDGLVISDVSNIESLQLLSFNSVLLVEKNTDYRIIEMNNETFDLGTKDIAYNCGIFAEVKADEDRDRTRIQISLTSEDHAYANTIWTEFVCVAEVRPLKRHLGAWIWCSRTISGDINVAYDVYNPIFETWTRVTFSESNSGTGDSKWTVPSSFSVNDCWTDNCHLAGFDCWADTPSTPTAILQCNTELF